MDLTARACHKILKVARTIADMEQKEQIAEEHLYEAIGYRILNSGRSGGETEGMQGKKKKNRG